MAENSTVAFGRYLKMLRERRGLSLQEVASLSDSFPDPISKGYLSRCENGHQKIALNKVIPLSRIYEVPADVIVERLELDMEVDRVGAPDLKATTYEDASQLGEEQLRKGLLVQSYATFRDGLALASSGPVRSRYRDRREQLAFAIANIATAANAENKVRFALHEFVWVLSDAESSSVKLHAFVLERVASAYLYNNQLGAALRYADAAIAEAESLSDPKRLVHAYGTRAQVAYRQRDFDNAVKYYKRSYDAAKTRGDDPAIVTAMNSLGQVYLDQGRLRAARRICSASAHLARQHDLKRSLVFALLVLGRVDTLEARSRQALQHLTEAQEICKLSGDHSARFGVQMALLRLSLATSDSARVRASVRRIDKIIPHVSWAVEELAEYRELVRVEVPAHQLP